MKTNIRKYGLQNEGEIVFSSEDFEETRKMGIKLVSEGKNPHAVGNVSINGIIGSDVWKGAIGQFGLTGKDDYEKNIKALDKELYFLVKQRR